MLMNEEMRCHTTFRIGGKIKYSFYPFNLDALKEGMKLIKKSGMEYKVVGKGSNLLWCDEDCDMIVIFLDHYLCNYEIQENIMEIEAGASIIQMANIAKNNSLSNLEFASGIPGTIGGAVFMNAGAYKMEMKDIVTEVLVLIDDEYVWMNSLDCHFTYRHSIFMDHKDWIIVKIRLQFIRKDKQEIEECMTSRRIRRLESQPLDKPSAGSSFKNPDTVNAWKLIDDAGLRGYRVGGAGISEKHCNFIVNNGNASCKDVKQVIHDVQEKVKEQFNICLHTEVEEFTCQKKEKRS